MTTLATIELTCPVCYAHFASHRIASTNSVGQDHGLRPARRIDPQPHYVHVCPECLFAAFEGTSRRGGRGAGVHRVAVTLPTDSRAARTPPAARLHQIPAGGALLLRTRGPRSAPGRPLPARLWRAAASCDLRSVSGKLPPVRDQGSSGSCWAFANYSSLESCLRPGDTADFSVNNLKESPRVRPRPQHRRRHAFMSIAYLARWSGRV